MRFLKRFECKCECPAVVPPPVRDCPDVPRTSPARLLARSLTDPETRGEWTSEYRPSLVGTGSVTDYKNEARDIKISHGWGSMGFSFHSWTTTPFTLSKAEEKMVEDAIKAFDRHHADVREAEALARLAAPAQAGEAGTAETPKNGSARRASTRSRSDAPK